MTAALIEAGADVNGRAGDERSPLHVAASKGHSDVVKELLRAKANPLLTATTLLGISSVVPLDIAAIDGHSKVVRELISQVGIEGCSGGSGGVDALGAAATSRHLGIMSMLMDAGVVDSGAALCAAAA